MMDAIVSLVTLLLVVFGACGGSIGAHPAAADAVAPPARKMAAMDYWHAVLPETTMPQAIHDLLLLTHSAGHDNSRKITTSYGSQDEEGQREVSSSYGSQGQDSSRKATASYMSQGEEGLREVSTSYGSQGQGDSRKVTTSYMSQGKEGLREVSTSYGSQGQGDSRKVTMSYMSQGKEGLREVSTSYGSQGQDDSRKATTSYMSQGEAGLREVSTSYTSQGQDDSRKATTSYMSQGEEGLREVSTSYGSQGQDDSRKATTSYMSQGEDGLREVSTSYGSQGQDDSRKATTSYMSQGKEGLREVSVSYGSQGQDDSRKATTSYMSHGEVGLREVSTSYESQGQDNSSMVTTSYGSQGQEDSRKITMSYQSKGQKESRTKATMSYHNCKDLRNTPTSYGSRSMEHSLKIIASDKQQSTSEKGGRHRHDHVHHSHSHSHGNQLADVFFFRDVLRPGSVITPIIPLTTSLPPLLHRHEADSLPFSTERFADIVAMLAPASLGMADEMRWTLDTCEHPRPLPGEKAGCATSLESLAKLPAALLGTRNVRAFSGDMPIDPAGTLAQRGRYNVTAVVKLSESPTAATCHDLTYPYAVFYCHTTNPAATYKVTLVAQDGGAPAMEVLAVCHLDTSLWNPSQPFLAAHNLKPGEVAVCHFLSKLSIIWVPGTAGEQQGGARDTR